MKATFALLSLFASSSGVLLAQAIPTLKTTDKKVQVSSTFYGFDERVQFSDLAKEEGKRLNVRMNATTSSELSGWKNPILIKVQTDSIQVSYRGAEYERVRITDGKDTVTVQVHYINLVPTFSEAYKAAHRKKALVAIPPVQELMHLSIALTPTGQKDRDMIHKSGPYYQKVMTRFAPYQNHAFIKKLDSMLAKSSDLYFNLVQDANAYDIQQGRIVDGTIYKTSGAIAPLLPLMQDFANTSKFPAFFAENEAYYQQSIARTKQLMPMEKMWQWIEKEYPNRYDCYKTVYSPLTGNNHSTRYYLTDDYQECIMFVCGSEVMDKNKADELTQQASLSGVVFTEIDHNYVNPMSDKHQKDINRVFGDRAKWAAKGGPADHYNGAYDVFNEYMTHALYCLYVRENYPKNVSETINKDRENLMVDHRKFIRFREFNQKLQELYSQRKQGQTAADLYPAMLQWSESLQ
ncbi:DUF4932 domain-containing protein [Tellurirhabdus bombi]|uniref:DUF4932 domain-containing protein n=1 Tax=Tellurirhabdus bombi TaxID=2907205 RepID=UPI001F39EE68|nr:DUF4932 domain-containing protein [Tellurirhabdus bombi]